MIRRAPRPDSGYVTIRNEVARDLRAPSFRCRGVLLYILSLPDDWRISREQLAADGAEGEKAVRAALCELEELGYLVRRRLKDPETGQFSWEHVVYDTPLGSGMPDPNAPGAQATGAQKPAATGRKQASGPTSTDAQTCRSVPLAGNRPAETGRLTKDHNKGPGMDWSGMAAQHAAQPIRPIESTNGDGRGYDDWRTEDRALFARLLEGDKVTTDGTRWAAGTYTVDALYDALAATDRPHGRGRIEWPGRWAAPLADRPGDDDREQTALHEWLAREGVEVAA